MRGALSDTTVLSNFAHARRPDLLRALFASLYVPVSVSEELAQGERGGLIPKEIGVGSKSSPSVLRSSRFLNGSSGRSIWGRLTPSRCLRREL
jgi:hypothetical protein